MASGPRCWGLFCDATGRPHFSPSEEAALAWSSFFPPGRTFKMYAAHLEKGRMLLGMGSEWKTEAVSVAGQGLAKAGGRSGSPRPAVTRAQLVELLTR